MYAEAYQAILFLAVYDKNVEDLTPAQKKEIAGAAQAFKDELQAGRFVENVLYLEEESHEIIC